jgi:hypothetical protein
MTMHSSNLQPLLYTARRRALCLKCTYWDCHAHSCCAHCTTQLFVSCVLLAHLCDEGASRCQELHCQGQGINHQHTLHTGQGGGRNNRGGGQTVHEGRGAGSTRGGDSRQHKISIALLHQDLYRGTSTAPACQSDNDLCYLRHAQLTISDTHCTNAPPSSISLHFCCTATPPHSSIAYC